MELIVVVVISAGMAENSQNGVSRSLMVLMQLKYTNHRLIEANFDKMDYNRLMDLLMDYKWIK